VIGCPPTSRRTHRRGLTLIEVLLVLCVIVMTTAMVWPALEGPLANHRLRQAADQVRTQWYAARVEAMTTDRVQVFCYTPGGRQYFVQSQIETSALVDPGTGQVVDAGAAGSLAQNGVMTAAGAAGIPGAKAFRLPEGVSFAGEGGTLSGLDEADSAGGPSLDDTGIGSSAVTSDMLGQQASEPIYFFPDGTTSNAKVTLRNKRGRSIAVSLRGLTGVVTVGSMQAGEESQP
jgi:type II secretory pathway pseudopilin PulG